MADNQPVNTFEQNIERLEAAIVRAVQARRDANSAAKEVRSLLDELRHERERINTSARKMVNEVITDAVKTGLEGFHDTIKTQTTIAHDKVIKEFDKLKNIMLFGNDEGEGQLIVHDWIRAVVLQEIRQYMKARTGR